MPFEITSDIPGWKAVHSQGRCGGPRTIFLNDKPLITDVCCRIDGIGDDTLHCKSAHVYHKAGTAIFESQGLFANGVSLSQSSRYFGNSIRTTTDFHWPKAVAPKKAVEAGSFLLSGRWTRMLVLDRSALADGPFAWQELHPGDSFQWETHPLSLVFQREDGVKAESSLGFDIWRWDEGLGIRRTVAASVEVSEECVCVRRFLSDAGNEENLPVNRDYRFVSILAWSSSDMASCQLHAKQIDLTFSEQANGITVPEVSFDDVVLHLDLGAIPFVESARRLGADGERRDFCMEDGFAITRLKRIIRQLAASSQTGCLRIRGLTPGLCLDGSHCAKKGEKLHWDLHSILTFTAWASNCLGEDWKIAFAPTNGWQAELPSLTGLHLCRRCL